MTNTPCHYESLKVTRDAPLEVIRAAYRSLSQKHHPDKNSGDQEAAQMMARLNAAYSVLSDAEQRRLYDLRILQDRLAHDPFDHTGESSDPSAVQARAVAASLLQRLRGHAAGKDRRIAAIVGAGLVVSLAVVFWSVRREHASMLMVEQAAIQATRTAAMTPPLEVAAPAAPSQKAKAATPVPETPKPAVVAKASAAPATAEPAPALKPSEYERLTAMLKSMGLGLHKLDLPKQAPEAKRAEEPAKPAKLAKSEKAEKTEKSDKPEKPAALAKAGAAPAVRTPAAKPAGVPDTHAARDDERPGAPELARAEARPPAEPSRTAVAPAATAPVAGAPRQAVIADKGACTPPAYPANAYRNGESGTVQLALLVGGDGRVVESKVQKSSGSAELDKAARKALSKCTFKPAGGDRQAEPVWTRLDYVFSLD